MNLDFITPAQTGEKWGIKVRRVWLIPRDALKPSDGRVRNGRKPTKKD